MIEHTLCAAQAAGLGIDGSVVESPLVESIGEIGGEIQKILKN